MTQSYWRHNVASLMVGRVTQSLDCRLPKAQVHMDAKATPRQKSYTSQLATEIKGKKK